MKYLITSIALTILLSLTSSFANAQETSPDSDKSVEVLEFKTFGLSRFWDRDFGCEKEIQAKYGFRYVMVAGCVMEKKDVKSWQKHNKRMERLMVKRHGDYWRTRYNEEVAQCTEEKNEATGQDN